jgi:hypothetical protein
MPTHGAENGGSPGLGTAVKQVTEHASTLIRLELELAQIELKNKLSALGVGIGLAAGAAVVGVFFVGFLFATIAAGLATFLPVWLSLLIVTLVLLATAAVLGLLARRSIRRGTPPVPRQAIHEAKMTTSALRSE